MTTEYDHGDFVVHALVTSKPQLRFGELGLDVESTAEEGDANRLRLVQLATPAEAWTFDISYAQQRAWLIEILNDSRITFWSHTNVDVWHIYRDLGVDISLRSKDTHTLAKLARPGKFQENGIKALSTIYLDDRLEAWDKKRAARFDELQPQRPKKPPVIRQRKKESDEAWYARKADWDARLRQWEEGVARHEAFLGWRDVPIDDDMYQQYAGMDAIYAIRLAPILTRVANDSGVSMDRIQKEQTLYQIVTQMRLRGQKIDIDYTNRVLLGDNLTAFESSTERFTSLTGLKPGSRPYVPQWLEERGVTFTEFNKVKDKETGEFRVSGPSLSAEPLLRLLTRYDAQDHDAEGWRWDVSAALNLLHDVGEVSNAVTVGKSFLKHADKDSRVHSWMKALGAETGRTTATEPAIQTITGKNRGAIIPYEDDHIIVSVDLSQIEPRIAFTDSGDTGMIDKIKQGWDIYDALAEMLFGPTFIKRQRTIVKRMVLATLYAGGLDVIVTQIRNIDKMQVTREEVEQARAKFYELAPRIRRWAQQLAKEADIRLASTRLVPGDPQRSYKSINSWVQGTARDLFMDVVLRVHEAALSQYIVNLIHDEILFSLPKAQLRSMLPIIRACFEVPYKGTPVITEVEIYEGGRWNADTRVLAWDDVAGYTDP